MDNEISAVMTATMSKIKEMVDTNTVVGCGSGAGVKVEPMGFLIVKDGNVRMLNVMPPASNTFDRLIDMTPQVIDRIDQFIDQRKADKA